MRYEASAQGSWCTPPVPDDAHQLLSPPASRANSPWNSPSRACISAASGTPMAWEGTPGTESGRAAVTVTPSLARRANSASRADVRLPCGRGGVRSLREDRGPGPAAAWPHRHVEAAVAAVVRGHVPSAVDAADLVERAAGQGRTQGDAGDPRPRAVLGEREAGDPVSGRRLLWTFRGEPQPHRAAGTSAAGSSAVTAGSGLDSPHPGSAY